MNDFQNEVQARLASADQNTALRNAADQFMRQSLAAKYSYNFAWLGRPIIQYPQDIVALEELIWQVKPDLIVETGIAHGGSLIFSASMLALIDYCEAAETGTVLDPRQPLRTVVGIDVDIRQHNRAAIQAHAMAPRIKMIQGSSTAPAIVSQVRALTAGKNKVMVCLDSNHTHRHVLEELQEYGPMVTVGSYCVVYDTVVEDVPKELSADRPWGPGNNPKTAVLEFLSAHPEFKIDESIDAKTVITVARSGYLKRVE
jgi:cephalosporin hydroxylase